MLCEPPATTPRMFMRAVLSEGKKMGLLLFGEPSTVLEVRSILYYLFLS